MIYHLFQNLKLNEIVLRSVATSIYKSLVFYLFPVSAPFFQNYVFTIIYFCIFLKFFLFSKFGLKISNFTIIFDKIDK